VTFVSEFKHYYSHFDQRDMNGLDAFYDPDAAFVDPIHAINGRDNLKEYFTLMFAGLVSCRFEFVGETLAEDSAWFKWVMHYQHPKLKQGEPLALTGATYLQFSGTANNKKIIRHEDFYDMGSMVYEHIPVMGSGIRWLKQQLLS
jgi:ketosteroid isomerase-like protein